MMNTTNSGRTVSVEEMCGLGPDQLAKNTIEYVLYLTLPHHTTTRSHLATLSQLRKHTLEVVNDLAGGYVWQRGEFDLEHASDSGFTYLRGITDYGDCVDDEWLIVFILRELTKKVPGLWAHVCDSDGEFLLIEAANAVPNWINPEVDQNRVWVHEGKIHLIPPSLSPDWGGFHNLSLVEAFGLIQMHHVSVPHFPALEIEAFSRLASYPEQITSCEYHCLLRMPRKLAYILHLRPKFIAPAIEAFKARESLGLRAIETAHFLPTFPAHDMVTTSVQFTKTLFVQLRSQQFTLPPAWGCTASELCRQDHRNESSSLNDERLELGMRVAIGFELLIQKARHRPSHTTRELAVLLGDLENGVSVLPTDYHIMAWENSTRQDDDRWLDIDYCDLEAELDGHKRTSESENMTGFGDPKMHVDLKRIVARFQEFLQDDAAELGGPNETLDEDDPERYSDNGERKRDGCDGWDSDNELYSNDGGDVILDKDELGQLVDSLKLVRSGSDWAVGEQRSLDSEISTNGRSQYDSFNGPSTMMELMDDDIIDETERENILLLGPIRRGRAYCTSNMLALMGVYMPRDDVDEGSIA